MAQTEEAINQLYQIIEMTEEVRKQLRALHNSQRLTWQRRLALIGRCYDITNAAHETISLLERP